jgi:hypothetical protein
MKRFLNFHKNKIALFLALTFIINLTAQVSLKEQNSFNDRVFTPIDLLNYRRFDVIAKYIYAKAYLQNCTSTWPTEIYKEHLRVWGNFIERGFPPKKFPEKIGFQEHLNSFNTLLNDIKSHGFNSQKSLVPVGTKGLYNGAHRLAACLACNTLIMGYLVNHTGVYATAEFFRNKKNYVKTGLAEKYLDAMALAYCALKKNTYIAILFPCAKNKRIEVKKIFNSYGHIVYQKNIFCHDRGLLNLILITYGENHWLSNKKNNFERARKNSQIRFCKKTSGYVNIYLLESDSLENIKTCKDKIRSLFDIGTYSIHINDTYQETLTLAQAFFAHTSVIFLNNTHNKNFLNFNKLISQLKTVCDYYKLDTNSICLVGNAPLCAYGLRDCNDLYIICHDEKYYKYFSGKNKISGHQKYKKYYPVSIDEIIYNPKYHFYYKNIKIATPEVIMQMKHRRKEKYVIN